MSTYEVAVVGAGLGGLAAAALAAKNRKRTLLIEPGKSVGGIVSTNQADSFRFKPGPGVSYGFERGGPFNVLCEQLGIPQLAAVHSPCYQVVFPDKRITIYAEQAETLEELGREFPLEIDKIRKLYRDLGKQAGRIAKSKFSSFLAERSAAAYIRSYGLSREFLAFLEAQSYYFFGKSSSQISLNFLIRLIDSAPSTISMGFSQIAEQILEVFLQNRGEVNFEIPLTEVKIGHGVLSLPQGSVHAKATLLNVQNQDQKSMIMLAVREEVLPLSMLREVIVVPNYERPDRFFTISVSGKDDRASSPAGARTITASFQSSVISSHEDGLEQIRKVIPFLDQFLIMVHRSEETQKTIDLPPRTSFKRIKRSPLLKSSLQGVYMLPDGEGTHEQSVSAAQDFIKRIL